MANINYNILLITLTILLSPFLMLLWIKKLKNKDLKSKDLKKIILLNDKEAYFLPMQISKEIPQNVLNKDYLLKQKFLNNQ